MVRIADKGTKDPLATRSESFRRTLVSVETTKFSYSSFRMVSRVAQRARMYLDGEFERV
jgi:hypothetical protein